MVRSRLMLTRMVVDILQSTQLSQRQFARLSLVADRIDGFQVVLSKTLGFVASKLASVLHGLPVDSTVPEPVEAICCHIHEVRVHNSQKTCACTHRLNPERYNLEYKFSAPQRTIAPKQTTVSLALGVRQPFTYTLFYIPIYISSI